MGWVRELGVLQSWGTIARWGAIAIRYRKFGFKASPISGRLFNL
ncbi:hypothetical protein QUA27_23480 [Microcoleus sp. Pol14C6]